MKKGLLVMFCLAACLSLRAEFDVGIDGIGMIEHDTTIVFTEAEYDELMDAVVMGFEGTIMPYMNTSVEVEIVRSRVGEEDEFCCAGNCVASNGELEQTLQFTFPTDKTGFAQMSSWYTHYTPQEEGDYRVDYTFRFADGSLTIRAIYRYGTTALAEVSGVETVEVYDIFGRRCEVTTLQELPTGYYIVHTTRGDRKEVKKVLIP